MLQRVTLVIQPLGKRFKLWCFEAKGVQRDLVHFPLNVGLNLYNLLLRHPLQRGRHRFVGDVHILRGIVLSTKASSNKRWSRELKSEREESEVVDGEDEGLADEEIRKGWVLVTLLGRGEESSEGERKNGGDVMMEK
ncbi:hypothetical protein JHK84_056942 [Glycine max]|nr:hypothetical protein JHK85_057904 [Glycine max]KAG5075711.1 hypothetical protein JHK84_056942 [Glycine max]